MKSEEKKQKYNNNCRKCEETFWTEDAFRTICPKCLSEYFTSDTSWSLENEN